jgi:hypothetical protein
VFRARGVVGEASVFEVVVETIVCGVAMVGDKIVSSIVAVCEVISEGLVWDSSTSSRVLLSGTTAARELLSRPKRLRRLDLDD